MAKTRHQNIVAAYLVLKKKNKVLLLKRHNTGYEDGNYSVIAGHVEPGESFRQTIIREAQENIIDCVKVALNSIFEENEYSEFGWRK
jgi:NADH pyrophosphatase NudC (nudix superfamily)